MIDYAEAIRAKAARQGISLYALAEVLGVPRITVYRWTSRNPKRHTTPTGIYRRIVDAWLTSGDE